MCFNLFKPSYHKPGRVNPILDTTVHCERVVSGPVEEVKRQLPALEYVKDYLTVNKYSRPGNSLKDVRGIAIHWVGNPMTSAKMNRDYFEQKKGGGTSFGSTQWIVDLDGDIILMMPQNEMAYHVGAKQYMDGIQDKVGKYPNAHMIGIECTHVDWSGRMTGKTEFALQELVIYLLVKHNLTAKDLYLHYDVTGKRCHRYYVDNPGKYADFRNNVDRRLGVL